MLVASLFTCLLATVTPSYATPTGKETIQARGNKFSTDIGLQSGKSNWIVGLHYLMPDNCPWAAEYTFETAEEVGNPEAIKEGKAGFTYVADDNARYTVVPIGKGDEMEVQYNGVKYGKCIKPYKTVECTSNEHKDWFLQKPWVCEISY